ncbi:Aldehyde oxidase 1 [Chlorella vulgaris]
MAATRLCYAALLLALCATAMPAHGRSLSHQGRRLFQMGGMMAPGPGPAEAPAPGPASEGIDIALDWGFNPYPDEEAMVGDSVTFNWSGGTPHGVYRIPDGTCPSSFSPAPPTMEEVGAVAGEGSATFKFDAPGKGPASSHRYPFLTMRPSLASLLLGVALLTLSASAERRIGAQALNTANGDEPRRSSRKQLLEWEPVSTADGGPGDTFVPQGGEGSWESGGDTGIIMIHACVMSKGDVVGWSARNMGLQEYGSAVYNATTRSYKQLLDECGVHDCKNSFCGAQTTTAQSEVLIFGGHANHINWFRSYDHGTGGLWSTQMTSGRWYPGVATLPDGKVIVVGGVADSGKAGYHVEDDRSVDNPSYEVYDPITRKFTGDNWEMSEQLAAAFPIHTYPHVLLTPDGGLAVSAGKLMVKYARTGPTTFAKTYDYPSRPGAPWSYPQTGVGALLPMLPPYDQLFFLAAGGTSQDRAKVGTPASDAAEIIELTEGPEASWTSVGPMPYPRVMGDALVLCDGTIGIFGGAQEGLAGWSKVARNVEYGDGTSWYCKEKCSKAEVEVFEPTIFDPATGQWSEKGTLATMLRPRLYHSVAVMMAGSDVTNDKTAEIFSPPYLNKGPQPVIVEAPTVVTAGAEITVPYMSPDPVQRAILIRNAAVTHSMAFDARALWLEVVSNTGCELSVAIPGNRNVLPPGMYMLVILSDKDVPSPAQIVSIP